MACIFVRVPTTGTALVGLLSVSVDKISTFSRVGTSETAWLMVAAHWLNTMRVEENNKRHFLKQARILRLQENK